MSPRSRLWLRRWHRRLGITVAIVVLLLSVSGIALNHSGSQSIPSLLARIFYANEFPEPLSFRFNENWLTQVEQQLFLDAQAIGECDGLLKGADFVELEGIGELLVIACRSEIQLRLPDGELVERLELALSLASAANINAFGACADFLCARVGSQVYRIDIDPLGVNSTDLALTSQTTQAAPTAVVDTIRKDFQVAISWQRFWLDVHSGRILGALGPWLLDLVAILFILLALTGLVVFRRNSSV